LPVKVVLANYIVRIYRFEKNKPGSLVGVVEEAGIKGKKAFMGLNEFWEIISSSKSVKNYRETAQRKTLKQEKQE